MKTLFKYEYEYMSVNRNTPLNINEVGMLLGMLIKPNNPAYIIILYIIIKANNIAHTKVVILFQCNAPSM